MMANQEISGIPDSALTAFGIYGVIHVLIRIFAPFILDRLKSDWLQRQAEVEARRNEDQARMASLEALVESLRETNTTLMVENALLRKQLEDQDNEDA
jgi:hypothetical protein